VDLSIRTLDASDVDAFIDLDDAAFSSRSDLARRAASARTVEWPRMLGAFDPDGLLCGAAGAFSQTLTLPGGARVPVAGVTAVGVLPTHRRRGVLRALMAHQLDDVADRGEALAVLTASEATIYRRFGYGAGTQVAWARLDGDRAELAHPPRGEWTMRLVDDAEAIEVLPAVFDAAVASRPGGLSRPDAFWPAVCGAAETFVGGGEHFTVVCRAPGGRAVGYAIYGVRRSNPMGHWTVVASEVVAADPEVDAALWRFLLDIDLSSSVDAMWAPIDAPLRWRLVDQRAYRVTGESDFLWVRVVDPVAALRARGYGAPGELVLDVDDPFRPATSGRYRLSVGTDALGRVAAAEVGRLDVSGGAPADGAADLTLDVAELGALYLGGVRASTLAAAGRIEAASPDALTLADRMFAPERAPYCMTRF